MGCTGPSPDSWRAMLADCWDAAAARRSHIKGDLDARERARRILAGRLARVLLALWLLDRRHESTAERRQVIGWG